MAAAMMKAAAAEESRHAVPRCVLGAAAAAVGVASWLAFVVAASSGLLYVAGVLAGHAYLYAGLEKALLLRARALANSPSPPSTVGALLLGLAEELWCAAALFIATASKILSGISTAGAGAQGTAATPRKPRLTLYVSDDSGNARTGPPSAADGDLDEDDDGAEGCCWSDGDGAPHDASPRACCCWGEDVCVHHTITTSAAASGATTPQQQQQRCGQEAAGENTAAAAAAVPGPAPAPAGPDTSCPHWVAERAGAALRDLLALATDDFQACAGIDGGPPEWRLVLDGRRNGVRLWSCSRHGSAWPLVRVCTDLDASPAEVLSLLLDDKRIREYDALFDGISVIAPTPEGAPAGCAFKRSAYKPVWPTAPRDFSLLSHWGTLSDGSTFLVNRSVEHSSCPEVPGFVRGTVLLCGFLLTPVYDSGGGSIGSRASSLSTFSGSSSSRSVAGLDDGGCSETGTVASEAADSSSGGSSPASSGIGSSGSSGGGSDSDCVRRCTLTMVLQTELKGSLPAAIVGRVTEGAPANVAARLARIFADGRRRRQQWR